MLEPYPPVATLSTNTVSTGQTRGAWASLGSSQGSGTPHSILTGILLIIT